MNRLGVIGTMVWDTIYGRGPMTEPIDEWGGIAYALAALEAELSRDWELVPLIKVGQDLAPEAYRFLQRLTRRSAAARFVEVAEPNNRVTLQYESLTRRCEHLTGGVPGWRWDELGPMVSDLDALYVNFISGFELDLATAGFLRAGFAGPIYADLHSLFLGVGPDGLRVPQPLADHAGWFGAFDVIQMNEFEMSQLGADPVAVAAGALGSGVGLLLVTVAERGAIYFTTPSYRFYPRDPSPSAEPIRTAKIPTAAVLDEGDPTGCGDVFGATVTAALLGGASVESAIQRGHATARRNLGARGATNLQYHLVGEIPPL